MRPGVGVESGGGVGADLERGAENMYIYGNGEWVLYMWKWGEGVIYGSEDKDAVRLILNML